MFHSKLELVGLLLFVAAIVAIVSRRLRVPYSVGLVAAGALLAISPVDLGLTLSRDLIFSVFLPPIVFEAAINLHWHDLRRNAPIVGVFASVGVVVAAAVVAATMHLAAGWTWPMAALFGTLIAATDPVSVIATFRNVRVDPRLHLLVESESLLNDGTAAVAFAVVFAGISGTTGSPLAIGGTVLWMVVGGIACGSAVAFLLLLIAGRTDDVLVELTLTTLIAYGSFLLADRLEMSGVLSTLAAGLVVGNTKMVGSISEPSRESVAAYWDYVAFLANSLIFLLLGAQIAQQPIGEVVRDTLFAIVAVVTGRALAIYGLSTPFAWTSLRLDRRHQHVLVWGGLRGALALGLVLSLPRDLPGRGAIVTVAFAVVAFSVIVQGLTMTPLLRRLRLIEPD